LAEECTEFVPLGGFLERDRQVDLDVLKVIVTLDHIFFVLARVSDVSGEARE